jgi:hypothetical protein
MRKGVSVDKESKMNRVFLSATVAVLAVSLSCAEKRETPRKQRDPESSSLIEGIAAKGKQAERLTWRSAKEALVELVAVQEKAFLKTEYPQLIRLLPAVEAWRPPPSHQAWEDCHLGENGELAVDLKDIYFVLIVRGEGRRWEFRGEFRRNEHGKWTAEITREKKVTLEHGK